MLYQIEVGQLTVADTAGSHAAIGADDEAIALADDDRAFAGTLVRGTWQDRPALDGYIAAAARNWRVERMAVIDRLILRLAIHELVSHPATPPRVVIDEAIELARAYSGEDAAGFVNGVMDGVLKMLTEQGRIVEG